jgi:hypothetical protein
MINYHISSLVLCLEDLRQSEWAAFRAINEFEVGREFGARGIPMSGVPKSNMVSSSVKTSIGTVLRPLRAECNRLDLDAACDRIENLLKKLVGIVTLDEVAHGLKSIRETIDHELKDRHFYYYPPDKAKKLLSLNSDWQKVHKAFSSTKQDIESAVDCYAVEQNTACIFHLMRVTERGLRALARERGIALAKTDELEWANWEQIINDIHGSIKAIRIKPKAQARADALEFYDGALMTFRSYKDVYRNSIIHTRNHYDENDALYVLKHVRLFMEKLSARIDETTDTPIDWGFENSKK